LLIDVGELVREQRVALRRPRCRRVRAHHDVRTDRERHRPRRGGLPRGRGPGVDLGPRDVGAEAVGHPARGRAIERLAGPQLGLEGRQRLAALRAPQPRRSGRARRDRGGRPGCHRDRIGPRVAEQDELLDRGPLEGGRVESAGELDDDLASGPTELRAGAARSLEPDRRSGTAGELEHAVAHVADPRGRGDPLPQRRGRGAVRRRPSLGSR
jgi:hypothetical protein